jgi:hypothetical protein
MDSRRSSSQDSLTSIARTGLAVMLPWVCMTVTGFGSVSYFSMGYAEGKAGSCIGVCGKRSSGACSIRSSRLSCRGGSPRTRCQLFVGDAGHVRPYSRAPHRDRSQAGRFGRVFFCGASKDEGDSFCRVPRIPCNRPGVVQFEA